MAAIEVKKKRGRPAKAKTTLKNVVTMKSDLEIKLEQAYANLEIKDLIIADLELMLDNSYKEQEEILAEVMKGMEMVRYHCSRTKVETGGILYEDIDYCLSLLLRVLKNKFDDNSTNSES